MSGCFEVSFNFSETFKFTDDSTYIKSPNKIANALEWAELVKNNDNEIMIQHLLQMGNDSNAYIIKHWRQDWLYQNQNLLSYIKDNEWRSETLKHKDVRGQWTQKVLQVDDSPRYVPQDGLLGWWPFTGNSNDLTANNNNGVVYDAFLTSDRFSYFNRAYNFQGNNDDVIVIPTSPSLSEMTDDFTISFWFYANDGSNGHLVDRDVCQYNPDWSFVWQSNQVVFRTSNDFYYSGVLPTNNWHHIVATRENGNFNLYANNSLSFSAFFNYAFTNTNAVIKIGDQSCSGTSPNFNGKIDDIGFWDRALTTNELSNVFDPCQSVTNATDTQVHCDTYTWIDGETYSSSNNTATFTFINANGCDSIATLNLTINNGVDSSDDMTSCESFDWNGVTYTETGVYTFPTTDANGCDSIATLNLTISLFDIIDISGFNAGVTESTANNYVVNNPVDGSTIIGV